MNILHIVGARPQFIKAHILRLELENEIKKRNLKFKNLVLFTAQHYDKNLANEVIKDLDLNIDFYIDFVKRDYKLFDISNDIDKNDLSLSLRLALMIEVISKFLNEKNISQVIIYGDTDSTLAGALSANLSGKTLIHIESGLRSYTNIPEERNRIVSDSLSNILFAPTMSAYKMLKKQFPQSLVFKCGDIMRDSVYFFKDRFSPPFEISQPFILVTLHRGENVDDKDKFFNILDSINLLAKNYEIIFSLHPRITGHLESKKIHQLDKKRFRIEDYKITFTHPLKYTHMGFLLQSAEFVITDSGGVQKEAFYHRKKCFVMRETTEWIELVKKGFSVLVNRKNIHENLNYSFNTKYDLNPYNSPKNAKKIATQILDLL